MVMMESNSKIFYVGSWHLSQILKQYKSSFFFVAAVVSLYLITNNAHLVCIDWNKNLQSITNYLLATFQFASFRLLCVTNYMSAKMLSLKWFAIVTRTNKRKKQKKKYYANMKMWEKTVETWNSLILKWWHILYGSVCCNPLASKFSIF